MKRVTLFPPQGGLGTRQTAGGLETKDFAWRTCIECGDDYPAERAELGYRVCLFCGEDMARAERKSWCVVQEYGKGPYQLVTASAAPTTLRQTNQKQPR